MSEQGIIVIDASNLILGRLASTVAKRLLNGERIIIVNAERAMVSGNKESVIEEAKSRLEIRTLGAKSKSPKHPRRPDGIVRRTVRGMLPWDKPKGKEAYKRLKVCVGIPNDLKKTTHQTLFEASAIGIRTSLTTIGEIAKSIGWKPSG